MKIKAIRYEKSNLWKNINTVKDVDEAKTY